MAKKTANVIRAQVTRVGFDHESGITEIYATDTKTLMALPLIEIRESKMIPGIKFGTKLTLWRDQNYRIRYLSDGNAIAEPEYAASHKHVTMDSVTQGHFDRYKKRVERRQAIQARLDEIGQKIALLRAIDTASNVAAAQSKQNLIEFLENQAMLLRCERSRRSH